MMMGGYSYDASPAELFFAVFKERDINPNSVPLGKTHFLDVLKLVLRRCQQIRRSHLILNWHHCMLYAFRYLSFYRI